MASDVMTTDGAVIQDEEGLKSVAELLQPICIAQCVYKFSCVSIMMVEVASSWRFLNFNLEAEIIAKNHRSWPDTRP